MIQTGFADSGFQGSPFRTVSDNDRAQAGIVDEPEGVHKKIDSLEFLKPGNGQDEIPVTFGPVTALGRRRIKDVRGNAPPLLKTGLDGSRLGVDFPDIPFEEARVDDPKNAPPDFLLHFASEAQLIAEHGPQVVVFAKSVVQPTDVTGMADGETRKTERNDVVDRPAQTVHADIRETIGQIGAELPAESVLRGQNKIGFVAALPEGLDGAAGDHQVSARDKGDIGGDDEDAFQVGGHVISRS